MKKTILGFFCGLAAGFYGAVSIIESHYISAAVVFILFAGLSIAYAKASKKRGKNGKSTSYKTRANSL